MLKFIIKDLPARQNVFVPVLLTEPRVNFGSSTAGGDIAQVRIQPVAARVRLFLGDDFNLIAHLQLIGKRHDAPADLRPDATVPHVTVDVVGEIERR
ncbi:hypothetical protein D3C71_1681410 [compost metagenome]